jgi:hypothetical protein
LSNDHGTQKQKSIGKQRFALSANRLALLMASRSAFTAKSDSQQGSLCASRITSGRTRYAARGLGQTYSLRRSMLGMVFGFCALLSIGHSSSHESSSAASA